MDKTKVALVSLPKNDLRFPLMGPVIIAGYVRDNVKNTEVKVIDNTFDNVMFEIEKFNPDIIGLSTFTSYYQDVIDFTKKIKLKYPNIKVIIGGPHMTTLPGSFDKTFDFGVIGEGEKTIVELIKAIRNKKSFRNINGLIYYDREKLRINKPRELSKNLDDVFQIDYSLFNKGYFKRKFIPEIFGFGKSMSIMTSIGCPFNCRFCSIKICWNRIRFRKVNNIIKEIKTLYYDYNIRHIDFLDDLFSINKQRLRDLIKELKKEKLLGKITFSCQARANTFDDEMCKIFKELGIKIVVFGFESGSDKILKYIKNDPTISVGHNRNAVRLCKKYGLNAYGCLMMGMPGEKLEDMQKTLDFIDFGKKMGIARLWAQILVPYPGTEVWEIAKKRGKIEEDFYKQKIHYNVREGALLLDDDVPHEEFVKKYNLAKKKCQYFVYKSVLKTIINNPLTIFYFMKEFGFYFRRYIEWVKQ